MVLARVSGVGSPASALARNDPTLLTKPDPSNPPSAGMISPSLPSACGLRRGASGGSLYPSRNGSFLPSAEVHLESIPADWREWRVNAANASALAHTLSSEREYALLFRTLATLRTDIPLFENVDELQWQGPKPGFDPLGAHLDAAVTGSRHHAGRRSLDRSDPSSKR